MPSVPIWTLNDAVPWIEGEAFDSHAETIQIEPIEFGKSEEKRLGLMGTPKVNFQFEPVIMKIVWRSPLPQWSLLTADPFTGLNIQFLGNISVDDAAGRVDERPYLIEATAIPDQHDTGEIEIGETPTYETTFNCTTLRQVIDGQEIFNFNLYAYVYEVNGVDLMAARRGNLGIG
ncbi:MAG: phage major tail tube protein [Spirulina sp.]